MIVERTLIHSFYAPYSTYSRMAVNIIFKNRSRAIEEGSMDSATPSSARAAKLCTGCIVVPYGRLQKVEI